MFYICLAQFSQVTAWYWPGTCCMLVHGALAGHVPGQARLSLRHWFSYSLDLALDPAILRAQCAHYKLWRH